jgi:hypothetical protein
MWGFTHWSNLDHWVFMFPKYSCFVSTARGFCVHVFLDNIRQSFTQISFYVKMTQLKNHSSNQETLLWKHRISMFLEYYPMCSFLETHCRGNLQNLLPSITGSKIFFNKFKQCFVIHASVKNHKTLCTFIQLFYLISFFNKRKFYKYKINLKLKLWLSKES